MILVSLCACALSVSSVAFEGSERTPRGAWELQDPQPKPVAPKPAQPQPAGARSAEPAESTPAAASDSLVLAAGDHGVTELIERVAQFLGRNYLIDQREQLTAAKITLQNPLTLTKESCPGVLEGFLQTQNLAVVLSDAEHGIYEVIHMQGPRRGEIMTRAVPMSVKDVLANRKRKLPVQCTIQLKHNTPQVVVNQLRPLLQQNPGRALQIVTAGDGSLVVIGFADQVAGLIDSVTDMDQGRDPADAEPVPVLREQLDAIHARLDTLQKLLQRTEARMAALEQRLARIEGGDKKD
jgi:type II secretory pathway component GspD/PulD (secretin)